MIATFRDTRRRKFQCRPCDVSGCSPGDRRGRCPVGRPPSTVVIRLAARPGSRRAALVDPQRRDRRRRPLLDRCPGAPRSRRQRRTSPLAGPPGPRRGQWCGREDRSLIPADPNWQQRQAHPGRSRARPGTALRPALSARPDRRHRAAVAVPPPTAGHCGAARGPPRRRVRMPSACPRLARRSSLDQALHRTCRLHQPVRAVQLPPAGWARRPGGPDVRGAPANDCPARDPRPAVVGHLRKSDAVARHRTGMAGRPGEITIRARATRPGAGAPRRASCRRRGRGRPTSRPAACRTPVAPDPR